MEREVGQIIRDAGNPRERDLYPMLKKLGKQYTQKQIRTWKKHYGHAADATPATISGQTASCSSTGAQLMTDVPSVPADIQEMENKVGPLIRSKGNPHRDALYAMLQDEGHHYTTNQVTLWKQHYGVAKPVAEELKDIDAEVAVSQYRDDVVFCINLGDGYKRLMKRLLNHGVRMTEHQARLALINVKYADLPKAQVEQWEDFANILALGLSREETICNIAEQRGWLVTLRTMRSMRSEYEKQLPLGELERRYRLGLCGGGALCVNSGGLAGARSVVALLFSSCFVSRRGPLPGRREPVDSASALKRAYARSAWARFGAEAESTGYLRPGRGPRRETKYDKTKGRLPNGPVPGLRGHALKLPSHTIPRYGNILRQRMRDVGPGHGGGDRALLKWLTSTHNVTCSHQTVRTWLDKEHGQTIETCVASMIDIFEDDVKVTPAKMIEKLNMDIGRPAVAAWLRHARLCHSFRNKHARPTWYLQAAPEMLLKFSDVINEDMNDPTSMEAAAGAGIYFATYELFKRCKERALIIHAWIQESSLSFAVKAYGIDPKTKGLDWLLLGGMLL